MIKLLLWLLAFLQIFINVQSQDRSGKGDDILGFFENLGYLKKKNGTGPGSQHSPKDMENAISNYQRFMNLNPTGVLDGETLNMTKKPRCGFPDIVRDEDNPFAPSQPDAGKSDEKVRALHPAKYQIAAAYTAPVYKWKTKKISWKVLGYTNQLGSGDQRRSFINAFKKWTDVIPLIIQETSGKADIDINFNRRDHGDGARNAFDGRGRVLAHAFYPGTAAISGDTHFDDDEKWSLIDDGTNLEITAAHEFGHALGLPHSRDMTALMAPIYRYDENYKLGSDDIRAIQRLYGAKTVDRLITSGPVVTPRPTNPPPPTPPPHAYCNLRFHGITEGHDGNIYAFQYKNIFKLDTNGGIAPGFPKYIRKVYQMAPINSNAVTYSRWTGKTYFFKGKKIWRFTGFRRDAGYPKVMTDSNYPVSPATAFVWRDGRLYIMKGPNYYVFDEKTETIATGYPKKSKYYWRNVVGNPDAAMMSRDSFTYFFKKARYWKWDTYYRKVVKGYPKEKASPWLGCGGYSPR